MKKTWKVLACVAGGAAVAVGSLVLADRYLGKNYLGRPFGKVIGRCMKDGKFYLYVRRLNNIYSVEVDEGTCIATKNGSWFDLSSADVYPESKTKVKPEEVINHVPEEQVVVDVLDNDEVVEELNDPVCDCAGVCKGEHAVAPECKCDCGDGEECTCGK